MASAGSATHASNAPSKARRIALYVLLGLVSLLFLFAGGQKVIGTEQMISNMSALHWSAEAARLLGVLEVILVAALWWRPARTFSLSILLLIMAGAAGSHIAAGDPAGAYAPIFGFAVLIGGSLVADRGHALWAFLFRKPAFREERHAPAATTGEARSA